MITHLIKLHIFTHASHITKYSACIVQNEDKGTQELRLVGPVTRSVIHLLNQKSPKSF